MKEKIGVFICNCGGTLFSESDAAEIASNILCNGKQCDDVFLLSTLCTEPDLRSITEPVRKKGINRIAFAGCSPARNQELCENIACKAGIAPSSIFAVDIGYDEPIDRIVTTINRGIRALSSMPSFETERVLLNHTVLVVGGGVEGIQTASEIRNIGYDTTLIENGEELAGRFYHQPGASAGGVVDLLDGVHVYRESRLMDLTGEVGAFQANIQTPDGEMVATFGAVVLATGMSGLESLNQAENPLHGKNFVVSMEQLEGTVSNLRKKNGTREIGLVLDMRVDETKMSMETALNLSIRLQGRGRRQVHLLCRDAKVSASGLQKLYDEAREAGVDIVKYEGNPSLVEGEDGVLVTCHDSILGRDISLHCDFVGISIRGLTSSADQSIADLTGVSLDGLGQMQDNNIHLFPGQTNRPGIFVVGSCRGQDYLPTVTAEAGATALAIHTLLEKGSMEIELSGPVVNPDKCILCLTCVRSCPFKAMKVDREKGAATSVPEVCRKCGICAGECPAKAIELPVFSDKVLQIQLGIV